MNRASWRFVFVAGLVLLAGLALSAIVGAQPAAPDITSVQPNPVQPAMDAQPISVSGHGFLERLVLSVTGPDGNALEYPRTGDSRLTGALLRRARGVFDGGPIHARRDEYRWRHIERLRRASQGTDRRAGDRRHQARTSAGVDESAGAPGAGAAVRPGTHRAGDRFLPGRCRPSAARRSPMSGRRRCR